jgi:Phytanoyl-CoA dioxygenase (PhyH)
VSDDVSSTDISRNEAIDVADDLVTRSRPLEAIRALTEANRACRDAGVEERLVMLRHDAFDALDHKPPIEPPPTITAETCVTGALPEIGPEKLDVTTLRRGLAHHGCVLVRGLVPADRVTALVDGIDRAFGAFDAGVAGARRSETSPWYVPFTPRSGDYRVGGRRKWMRASGGIWTVDSPRMLFELFELLDETGIGELVAQHFGERPALSANKCNLRRVPVDANTNWHQDGAFLGAEVRSLNLWIGLSHCGREAPGLDILPRRLDEVLETGTEGAIFDWSVGSGVVEDLAASTPVLRPELAPGDAVLFDHLLLHRTAIAPDMTRERHAIETWFFAPSLYPSGQIPIVA